MKTKTAILALLLVALIGIQATPSRTIKGTVNSADDGGALPGVNVVVLGTSTGTVTGADGKYSIPAPDEGSLVFTFIGFKSQTVVIGRSDVIDVRLEADHTSLSEVVVTGYSIEQKHITVGSSLQGRVAGVQAGKRHGDKRRKLNNQAPGLSYSPTGEAGVKQAPNDESYKGMDDNTFQSPLKNPLSTFSIDVDAASYANVRRFINDGQQPPKDAVRVEEMINYFHYDYPQPAGENPFSINTEIATAPWNPKHKIVSIGLQGKIIPTENLPPANLVFLIDVSGSMSDENKLPLLVSSFKMLVRKMREQDHVAIVVYAGAAGLVLPSTSGSQKTRIIDALEQLQAGGSTAGGAGIELAYAVAKENFKKEGNNRVILATDGDFNVGESSDESMEALITRKREDGIFLTVLGFGMGNYKDSKMEILADKGNGNYAYIDSFQEAQKVFVHEFGGTLFTIAKDVKLQIEFNPAKVQAYRLIGYENRMLKDEDFNNDKKDAGELGAGHTVTALYEVIPVGAESPFYKTDELKYQPAKIDRQGSASDEIMTVKFRYKKPNENTSKLIVHPLIDKSVEIAETSDNFRWAVAVAGFGMMLRDSEYTKDFSQTDVLKLARNAKGKDDEGYRAEFINLVSAQELIARR